MILGDVCTRSCRFCAVTTGNPKGYLDETEPERVAEAVKQMMLRYVVLTSVDRDDLEDGGAAHFARTIRMIKREDPNVLVEPLIPDFTDGPVGARHAVPENLKEIIGAKPDVIAHNLETVKRLTPHVRDRRMSYELSLSVLRVLKELDASVLTKSGVMVGLGETDDEVHQTMEDMRKIGVDFLTIGQYLQPTRNHLKVERFVTPQQFKEYEKRAKEMGFLAAACAPLVRSSYHASDAAAFLKKRTNSHASSEIT